MTNLISIQNAGAAVLVIGSVILFWWLTARLRSGALRTLIRIIALPLLVIGIVLMTALTLRTNVTVLPENTPIRVPVDSMTVEPGTLTDTLNATGSLAPAETTTLSFGSSAPVTAVNVSVGDVVHKGDVLATVDTTALDFQVRSAQINLQSAQNALAVLQAPPSDLDLKSAQLSVEAAQASLGSASLGSSSATVANNDEIARLQAELAKNQLWQQQLSRDMSQANANPNAPNATANRIATDASLAQQEQNVTNAEQSYQDTLNAVPDTSQLASADASLLSAQAKLDALTAGPSDSDLRKAQINVETAQLNLDTIQQQRDDAQIVAPFDGIVAAVNIQVGEMPAAGAITLINTNNYTITVSVDEKDIPQLAVGQAVDVSLQALPTATLTGTVTRVDLAPASTTNLVTYNVDVTLNPSDTPVRPGMSAVANVVLSQLNGVLVVPNRFITINDQTQQATVLVETADGVYTTVPVTLGEQTDSESVITSGVKAGDKLVVLASSTSTGSQQTGGFGLFGAGRLAGGAPPGGGEFNRGNFSGRGGG